MDWHTVEQLERLQRLRETGALSEAEFRVAKEKLLARVTGGLSMPRWSLIGGLTAGAILLAIAAGLWLGRDVVEPRPIAESERVQRIQRQSSAPPTPPVRSPAVRLADAFQAATGRRSAYNSTENGDTVTIRPLRIVELPFGAALLTSREIKDGCHACKGALGVFYLKEKGSAIEVVGRWPTAVEGWGWGAPPSEWHLTNRFTANAAIFASGGYMGQGVVMESATITELHPSGPVTSDLIGTGFSDEGAIVDEERLACTVEGKIENIRKDASFEVLVRGSVKGVDRYVKRSGRFVADSKIDWGIPCGG